MRACLQDERAKVVQAAAGDYVSTKILSVPVHPPPPHMYQVLFGLLVEKDDDIPCHGCIFFTFIAVGEGGGRIIGYELFWSRLNGGGRT